MTHLHLVDPDTSLQGPTREQRLLLDALAQFDESLTALRFDYIAASRRRDFDAAVRCVGRLVALAEVLKPVKDTAVRSSRRH